MQRGQRRTSVSEMIPIHRHLLLSWLLLGLLAGSSLAEDGIGSLQSMARSVEKCSRWSELGTCLRMKALTLLDRAVRSPPFVINEYLSLEAEKGIVNSSKPVAEDEIIAALPKGRIQKETALDEMIADKVSTLIKSRSIKFNIPSEESALGEGKPFQSYIATFIFEVLFLIFLINIIFCSQQPSNEMQQSCLLSTTCLSK